MQATPPGAEAASQVIDLDPLALLLHAPGPVRVVNWALLAAAVSVWIVAVLKARQLSRLAAEQRAFEAEAETARGASHLTDIARGRKEAPGARVVLFIAERGADPDLVDAHARRALVAEEQRSGSLLGLLSTVGSAGPFVGLFGTVWGILDAFLRIGREKSASLPVVAPAIGEALIATAVGLFAAIPAVILFNILSKRQDDLLQRLEAASAAWIALFKRPVSPAANDLHSSPPRPSDPPQGAFPWPQPRPADGAASAAGAFPTSTSRPSST
ncbi:MAG: MotA/TolQ/ExbB proton channel family protein [Polyangiaceae bacterium]